jgi:hypothetical protein
LIEFPPRLVRVSSVRSTLLQASIGSLKLRNYYDRYRALLPREFHEAVLETLAPMWLPVEAALAHYEACEQLGLSEHEQLDIGCDVGRRIQRSALSTIARASRAAGVTPWLGLASVDRMWVRLMQGGGARVMRSGPKDSLVEFEGIPLARFMYFRNAFRGLLLAACELFAKTSFVRTLHPQCGPMRLAYRLSWV